MTDQIIMSMRAADLGGFLLKTIPDITPKAGIGSKAIQDLAGNMLFVVLILCGIGVLLAAACIALGWLIKNGTLKSVGIAGVLCSVSAAAIAAGTTALINFGIGLQLV
ncbi:MAG TPA: hypothetical protein VNJ54_05770 [Plantibacter sp.]|uniref:hypothetical protein n=1 Tax=unclassified Plantibacter TaxID=2624265 RepID=UPI002BF05578|nr:hypothetical protein [Plantibacter sp.]